jgi:ABC-type sugar transport system ATPase subunit
VRAAVELAMRARGEASPKADAVLSMLGIQALATRRVSALRLGEERAVELALALSTPRLALLALHEPLCDVTLPASADLFGHLATSVEHGACVLVLTSSQADAHALTDHVLVLEKGKAHERAAASVGAPAELTVWVAGPEARSLTSALATHPSVSSLSFRETANPGATPMSEIRLAGGDLEALALELSDTAIRVGANVQAIVPSASAACSWRPWGRAPGSIGLPRGSGDGAAPPHSARPRRGDE